MRRKFNAELLKKKPVVIGQTDSNRLILYIIIMLYSKPKAYKQKSTAARYEPRLKIRFKF